MTVIIVLLVIGLLMSVFVADVGRRDEGVKNTTERTALSGQVNKTDWYQDNLNWVSNKQVLINGLERFYKETGIQPYVLLLPYDGAYWNGGGSANASAMDAYLDTVYEETFTDEAHFIFAYFAAEADSKGEMEGEFRYLSGYSADTIMDSEALKIFWGYFQENYYNTRLSLESMIADTFADTAERIMSRPTNVFDTLSVMLWVVGIIVVVIGAVVLAKKAAQRRKEKEEYNKKILETPLETFGSQTDTSEIEKKYENKE